MIKKIVFFAPIFVLTLFVTMQTAPLAERYGFADYLNILFCNTALYPLYGRSNWDIINLMFFLVVLIAGVYFVSEKNYTYGKGFRAMAVFRYNSCRDYLRSCQKENVRHALGYIFGILVCVALSLAIVDVKAFGFVSDILTQSTVAIAGSLMCYLIKIFLLLTLIELWMTYLVLDQKFEFLIMLFIIAAAFLLFLDVIFGLSLVSLSLSYRQIFYVAGYIAVYIFSVLFVGKKYKSKEIW